MGGEPYSQKHIFYYATDIIVEIMQMIEGRHILPKLQVDHIHKEMR